MKVVKQPAAVAGLAGLFTLGVLTAGYLAFGPWTTLVFTSGFLGGFVLWLLSPARPSWAAIKIPHLVTLATFVLLHRVEEYLTRFQARLAELTGTPTPPVTSAALIALLMATVGAWLLIPFLVKRGLVFGYYLAWTLFTAMGVTELAHFVFPLFTREPYGYFPGMASVLVLAPVAWWGIWRLSRTGDDNDTPAPPPAPTVQPQP